MRQFVIITPGLTVGPPGSHMTGAEIRMTDDKLDEFVQAGHAVEIYVDGPPTGRVAVDEPIDDDDDGPEPEREAGFAGRLMFELQTRAKDVGIKGRTKMDYRTLLPLVEAAEERRAIAHGPNG